MERTFFKIGKEKTEIEVRISYRIIQLFSEGLYASPHKAKGGPHFWVSSRSIADITRELADTSLA
jgi:hypothetical protein